MASRVDALLRGLLRLLLDVSSDSALSDAVRQKLMSEAVLCIKLLDGCCHGSLQVSSGLPSLFAQLAALWSCDSDQGCNNSKVSQCDKTSVLSVVRVTLNDDLLICEKSSIGVCKKTKNTFYPYCCHLTPSYFHDNIVTLLSL